MHVSEMQISPNQRSLLIVENRLWPLYRILYLFCILSSSFLVVAAAAGTCSIPPTPESIEMQEPYQHGHSQKQPSVNPVRCSQSHPDDVVILLQISICFIPPSFLPFLTSVVLFLCRLSPSLSASLSAVNHAFCQRRAFSFFFFCQALSANQHTNANPPPPPSFLLSFLSFTSASFHLSFSSPVSLFALCTALEL